MQLPSVVHTDENPMATFYGRRHPRYSQKLPHWIFCESTYDGGRDWFTTNIFRYLKEGEKEFADRLERAYRPNHTKETVDLVQKYLFKGGVNRDIEGAPDVVKEFWQSATRNGETITEMVRRASTKSSLTGRCAIVVDSTANLDTSAPVSIRDAKDQGIRVYAYVVPALDVLDYSWSDKDGKLSWIKLREFYRDDKDPINSSGETFERVRLWTRNKWELYEKSEETTGGKTVVHVELVDQGEHKLGYVPVYLLDHSAVSDQYDAAGLVDDIAYLDRAVANYLSNLDAIIQDQTFSQLAIPAQSMSNVGTETGARNRLVEMGTKRIFLYDAGAGASARPEFISPDPKQASVILSVVNKIINEIYSTIGLAGERTKQDNAVGIDNSSGVAKAYDFERVNSLLTAKAQRLERLENWIVTTVLDWMGEERPSEELVSYPTTFDVATLGDDLVTAKALFEVDAPIEIRREQMKVILDKLLPQVKQETWDAITAAIDKWQPTPKVAPGLPKPGAEKSAAEKPRQGSVTPDTKSTPKSQPK